LALAPPAGRAAQAFPGRRRGAAPPAGRGRYFHPFGGPFMTPTELYKAGKLGEAIDGQVHAVKTTPGDHGKRLFLFELLAFAGDLDRARRQIDAVNYGQMELDTAVLNYRKLLDAEEARRRVFREGIMPQFLVPPPEHVGPRLEAVNRLRAGEPAEAARLLDQANDAAPPVRGLLNGKPFDTLRDADDLFGPVLEVMAHGDYYWLPLDQVVSLAMNAPKFPRDLLWLPAKLAVKDGPAGDVFLPALYPGSCEHPDDQIKLGRATDWKQAEGGPVLGVGLRMFLAGEDATSLLEWRELQAL
jgi:type VI secretion system protein ImpE